MLVDVVFRFWRNADFELDHMLAQYFNYEYEILFSAWKAECQHIVRLYDFALSIDSVIFE